MTMRTFVALAVVAVFASLPSAQAGIISHSPTIEVLDPAPADARPGMLVSNTHIRAWAEQQNVVLSEPLEFDITQPGTSSAGGNANLSPAIIAAGTAVHSYFLHLDQEGTPGNALEIGATITFSTEILGIAVRSATLNATDAFPGLSTTIYATGGGSRGLEFGQGGGGDSITLSADLRTIELLWRNRDANDEIRVLTAVPEPSSVALTGVAAIGLMLWRLHGRRRA